MSGITNNTLDNPDNAYHGEETHIHTHLYAAPRYNVRGTMLARGNAKLAENARRYMYRLGALALCEL